MDAKIKYKDIPAYIKKLIRKNKKLNKKIDIESRRQKKFTKEIHELNLKRKQLSIQENIKRKELIKRLNDDKIKLKKLKEKANEENKLLKNLIIEIHQKRIDRKNKIIEEDIDISNLFDYDPNQRYCDVCNIKIHRASMAKHLKSKKHLNNKEDQTFGLDQETEDLSNHQSTSKSNPKSLRELAGDKIKLNNRELNKLLAKKMLNPYYFKNKNLYNILKINLDSHHINHLNSKITISSTTVHNEIDKDLINELVKEMCIIYARLISQYKFKYQCTFFSSF